MMFAMLAGLAEAAPAGGQVMVAEDGSGGVVLANVLPTESAAEALPATSRRRQMSRSRRAPARSATTPKREALGPMVAAAAARHDLPEALLNAVIRVESNFDPQAVSSKGARGPMQLMPGTARYLGVENVRDPASNIDGGAKYLKELLARFGNDLGSALAAYNAGPGAVVKSGGIPAYAETREYVPKVVGCYHAFEAGFTRCLP